MRIENLRAEKTETRARVAADVVWEDNDRPKREIFFETESRFADSLSCNPHAFLVACIVPAFRHQETRIRIDAEVCPELLEGLEKAMMWIRSWYGADRKLVAIESRINSGSDASKPGRAGVFLSGGIDSLAALRANRLRYPPEHPGWFKDAFLVHGFDIGAHEEGEDELSSFELARDSLLDVVADTDIELIIVFTNIRYLDKDVRFWMHEFHGAALSAVAHTFANRIDRVSIAASLKLPNQRPWGSHPCLDTNYSSHDLRICHVGNEFSRLDKIKLLADWELAFQNMRVCTANREGMLNCGRCEKCLRTMTELVSLGLLEKTKAFPTTEISEQLLGNLRVGREINPLWLVLIGPLREIGRSDLVRAIERMLRENQRNLARRLEKDWRGRLRRFDRKYLAGTMVKVNRFVRGGGGIAKKSL